MQDTLEKMLKARMSGDNRANVAVIGMRAGKVVLSFGAVGPHTPIVLGVGGNEVTPLHPVFEAEPVAAEAEPVKSVDAEPVRHDKHSKVELLAMAPEGLAVDDDMTKREIADAINAFHAQQEAADESADNETL